MKNLIISALILTSASSFASTFENIKTFTNKKLNQAYINIADIEMVPHIGSKKVLVLKANGKTEAAVRKNTMAQAMHTMCPFFDDGVAIGVNTKDEAGSKTAMTEFMEDVVITENNLDYLTIISAIKSANKEESVEVYSGSASGNNTYGSVLGFFDVKNNEIAVFAITNCGRDD